METWSEIQAKLDAIGRDKKWLAGKLGIEKIQNVDHWQKRGVPHKYRPAINDLFSQSNHPLSPVNQAQLAITNVASLDQAMDVLSAHLSQVEPGRRESVATLMASLVRTPDDAALRNALEMLLTPSGFADPQKRAA